MFAQSERRKRPRVDWLALIRFIKDGRWVGEAEIMARGVANDDEACQGRRGGRCWDYGGSGAMTPSASMCAAVKAHEPRGRQHGCWGWGEDRWC